MERSSRMGDHAGVFESFPKDQTRLTAANDEPVTSGSLCFKKRGVGGGQEFKVVRLI